MENFNKLPLDLKCLILSYDDILKRMRLNKELYARLKQIAFAKFGPIAINKVEFNNYMKTNPRQLFIFDYTQKESLIYLFTMVSMTQYIKIISENFTPHKKLVYCIYEIDDHLITCKKHKIGKLYFFPEPSLDLLSTFKILKERLGCQNIDFQYAKNETLFRLNRLINQLSNGPATDIISLYQYLISHTWIFNINIQVIDKLKLKTIDGINLIAGEEHNSDFVRIKQQIFELIPLIRDKIIQLT